MYSRKELVSIFFTLLHFDICEEGYIYILGQI